MHLTPQGLVDLNKWCKSPRPVFNLMHHPEPWCNAINDWTCDDNEPPIGFLQSEVNFVINVCNLRVSHPFKEIYLADDDVKGAFCLNKCNQFLVALHVFVSALCALVPSAVPSFRGAVCALEFSLQDPLLDRVL